MMEALPFSETPRGQLARARAKDAPSVEPVVFYGADGTSVESSDPGQINRWRLSRGLFETPEAAANPLSVDDHRFHPSAEGVKVADVLRYLDENPDDAARVLDEERAGQARSTILDKYPTA